MNFSTESGGMYQNQKKRKPEPEERFLAPTTYIAIYHPRRL